MHTVHTFQSRQQARYTARLLCCPGLGVEVQPQCAVVVACMCDGLQDLKKKDGGANGAADSLVDGTATKAGHAHDKPYQSVIVCLCMASRGPTRA